MGKTVDLGALLLQNENVRAVGNMNINARGDILDSNNRVTEPKNRQVQGKYRKQTNVSTGPVSNGTVEAKQYDQQQAVAVDKNDTFSDLPEDDFEEIIEPAAQESAPTPAPTVPQGGLAAAIARSREVKQELEKPRRLQTIGLKKI